MKNLDVFEQKKLAAVQKIQEAVKNDDSEAFAAGFTEFSEIIAQRVTAKYEESQQSDDVSVLASRGVRQLTSEENNYFQKLGDAMKSANPKQALADMDVVMPKTTIDAVFEDLVSEHPLLEAIDFVNTSGLVEFLVNTHENQTGTWGALTAEVTKELTSGFKKIPLTLMKYSAFIPVAKSMLDLGPAWLEAYVRTILQETIYLGLEEAIITGDGKDKPIGMNRQVGDKVTVTAGVYPEKTAVSVTSLEPVAYGSLLAGMAKTPDGKQRAVTNVIMLVSPSDYLTKIMPATTYLLPTGTYASDVLPYPTKIIQSVFVTEGKMIVGLAKKYFMGIGTAKSGKIEYSDDYHFLEDERVYLCKLYGNGMPKDNNAFAVCNISKLKPAVRKVEVVSSDGGTGGTSGSGSSGGGSGTSQSGG